MRWACSQAIFTMPQGMMFGLEITSNKKVKNSNNLLTTLTLNSGDEFIVGTPKQCHFMGKMCCQMSWL
jgi:hypothetical protein